MRTVAICCTLARPSLDELLGMWALQSVSIPLFVALDVGPSRWPAERPVNIEGEDWRHNMGMEWVAQRAPESVRRGAHPNTIGPLRAWAVEQAERLWSLTAEDAFLVLDDDDYYAPIHARATMQALDSFGGQCVVGARDFGILWRQGQEEPEMVRGGPYGPGPHATWGMPLRLYHAHGGYQADPVEDLALLSRIGWHSARTHFEVTHVRTQDESATVSSTYGNRAKLESTHVPPLLPRVTPRSERLRRWCNDNQP